MVHRPPWQKNARMPMVSGHLFISLSRVCASIVLTMNWNLHHAVYCFQFPVYHLQLVLSNVSFLCSENCYQCLWGWYTHNESFLVIRGNDYVSIRWRLNSNRFLFPSFLQIGKLSLCKLSINIILPREGYVLSLNNRSEVHGLNGPSW